MRGITLIFGICAAASLVPVHAQDDAIHGIEGTAVSNPHIDIARVKPIDGMDHFSHRNLQIDHPLHDGGGKRLLAGLA